MEMNDWVAAQVGIYKQQVEAYRTYARVLKIILDHAKEKLCESAIISTRAKEISSFAGKCVKQYKKLCPPKCEGSGGQTGESKSAVEQMTDLCGGRVIVPVLSQIDALAKFVKDNFEVILADSQDTAVRLKPDEFGYLSVHFIVKIKPDAIVKLDLVGAAGAGRVALEDIDKIKAADLKAEIQLRTIAQHAWADFSHDLIYKSPFTVPRVWQRDSARVAAQVEIIDETIEKIVTGMRTLQTNAGNYMPPSEAKEEIERLKTIIKYSEEDHVAEQDKAKNDVSLVHRAARLMVSIADYHGAIELTRRFKDRGDLNIRFVYGDALCRLHQSGDLRLNDELVRSAAAATVAAPAGEEPENYELGRRVLEEVIEESGNSHVEAMTRFAQTVNDPHEQRKLFEAAYRVAPNDPQVLGGYLLHELQRAADASTIRSLLRPNINTAISICDDQITARVNLPGALWAKGALHLLRGEPMEALFALSRAICLINSEKRSDTDRTQVLEEHYGRFIMLNRPGARPRGLDWCLDLFRLALSKPGALYKDLRKRNILLKKAEIRQPVAIIAGGCDPHHADRLDGYSSLLSKGFENFKGTIISGGTQEGISGLAGQLVNQSLGRIIGVGYLPLALPRTATVDANYTISLNTEDDTDKLDGEHAFTPAQPIQSWIDLLAGGVDPKKVKLIGVDGGLIAGFEYHLAAALGAQVAIVRGSGRQADQLLVEAHEPGNEALMFIPDDPWCANAFIRVDADADPIGPFDSRQIDLLTEGVHVEYSNICRRQVVDELEKKKNKAESQTMRAFEDSSRQQALDIQAKLKMIGKEAVPESEGRPAVELTPNEKLELAKAEHGRWVVERLRKHWRLGPDDEKAKTRTSLKSWEEIDSQDREKDVHAIDAIPRLLELIKFKIVELDRIARAIHEDFISDRKLDGTFDSAAPSHQSWELLEEQYKDANRDQARAIPGKLAQLGFVIRKLDRAQPAVVFELTDDQIEMLARQEHERWMANKLKHGWVYGSPHDKHRKLHPSLVPYDQLSESEKKKDRAVLSAMPKYLHAADYQVVNPNR